MSAFELRIERLGRELFDGVALREGEPRCRVDLAVLACFEDERPLRGLAALVDWRTAGALSKLLREGFCTGRRRELMLLPGRHDLPTERIVVVGLGPRAALDAAAARAAAIEAVTMALRLRPLDVLFALPDGGEDRELSEALVTGVVLGLGGELPGDAGDGEATAPLPEPAPAATIAAARSLGASRSESDGDDREDDATARGADDGAAIDADPADSADSAGQPRTPRPGPCRWWVIADPRHAGRLRRLLEGPPRATEAQPSG